MPAIKLYEYQKRWLINPSRWKCWMASRQIGKTFTTTLEIVDDCFKAIAEGRRARWVILSRGERQAREAMEEGVKRHAKAYSMAIETLEYDWQDSSYKALEVILPGGSRITALPANDQTARGYSASIFLDEYSWHPDSRKIWTALFPVVSAGHKLRVTSTPNGKNNHFYDLMTSSDPLWSRHITTIHDAIADGLPRSAEELCRALGDDEAWRQEYLCEFVDSATAWLPYDLINNCEHELAGIPENYQGGKCFIGNDIGRQNDLWAAFVWEQVGDVLWCREIKTLQRASFAEHDATLDDLMNRYDVVRLAIDRSGLGEKPVEDAARRYGQYRVEGVHFTSAAKQHLAILGKQAFEDRKVRIPLGDSVLRADLHKLRKITTPLGNVRFDADRDSQGHADRTWAAFLGIYAAGNQRRVILPPDFGTENNLSTWRSNFGRIG